MHNDFTTEDLAAIREAVPGLDLRSIRALRRAGFDIIHNETTPEPTGRRTFWHMIPRPMATAALNEHAAAPSVE
jgi:hypothetical protein